MSDDSGKQRESRSAAQPLHGELQHRAVTARVREQASRGAFANAAIVLSGQHEFVIDFVLRMGQPDRVAARVVLSFPVAEQFVDALQDNIAKYERQFGPIPDPARLLGKGQASGNHSPNPSGNGHTPSPDQPLSPEVLPGATQETIGLSPLTDHSPATDSAETETAETQGTEPTSAERAFRADDAVDASATPAIPSIEEIYSELRLDDDLLGGMYANGVLIRHTATEFCFDFVANIFPRSIVNARVYLAAPHVPALATSLAHSCRQHRRRMGFPGSSDRPS